MNATTGTAGAFALLLTVSLSSAQPLVTGNQQSLNDLDRIGFGVGQAPFDRSLKPLTWKAADEGSHRPSGEDLRLSLNGTWDLKEAPHHGQSEYPMLAGDAAWRDAIPAKVPCSVQTALLAAGKIQDPMLKRNNLNITWVPEREWWLRRKFQAPSAWRGRNVTLRFDGVDYRATFWLNGRRIGQHEGMFGGPDYDITTLIRFGRENELVVSIDPAPPNYEDTFKNNVAYGWHYVNLVTSGIWRGVTLEARDGASLGHPFLRTRQVSGNSATVDLALDLWKWGDTPDDYSVDVSLTPKNFEGPGFSAAIPVKLQPGNNEFGFSSDLRNVRLWWPVDMGLPNLYNFRAVLRHAGTVVDVYESNFGIRTLRLVPNSDGPKATIYNGQFVINGQFIFMKGANWCYPDALLRLEPNRQRRFLTLARDAHIQYIRVWGGGPVENDALYDACDELGILVQQEFSMLGYHRLANVPSIHATDITEYMVKRLRNRPSLAVWCGANEISGLGRIVEVLGRRCLELDGTRDFWRTDPYGGKSHWYGVYWSDMPLLAYRKVADGRIPTGTATPNVGPVAFTEFGLSSPASIETWRHILPEGETERWPIPEDSPFVHHTPTFNYIHVKKMMHYAGEFLVPKSLQDLINGMQLSQGLGVKMLIESMRSQKPRTTQTTFYKLTENYPASSWATIDYYGIPKLSHYLIKEAYAPVHVMALYDDWDSKDGELKFSIRAANDTAAVVQGSVRATLYDAALRPAWRQDYPVEITPDNAREIANVSARVPAENGAPLLLCLDLVSASGQVLDRDWSYFNFTAKSGSLFERPHTSLVVRTTGSAEAPRIEVHNTGALPAFGVTVDLGKAAFSYYADAGLLWLMPGETKVISLLRVPAIDVAEQPLGTVRVSAWNSEAATLELGQNARAAK